ncbi:multidrug effflux MFS transporter [Actinoplanes sp. NPDC000266]
MARQDPLTLAVLGALSAIGPLSMALYLPALPALTVELGAEPAHAELTVTACMLGLAAGQMIVGPLSDRYGRRPPLLIGMLLYAISSLACAFAPSLTLLIVLRFAQGAFGGAGIVIARAIVRDLCDTATAARVFSTLVMITSVAPVVAPLLGGQLLLVTSWKGVFVALCAIGVALLIAVVVALPESLPAGKRHGTGNPLAPRRLAAAFGDPRFRMYASVLTLGSVMLYCYVEMSSFVLQHDFGLSAQQYSFAFATMAGGMVAAASAGSALVRRKGAGYSLTAGLVVAAAGSSALLAAAVADVPVLVFLAILLPTVSSVSLIVPATTALSLADQDANIGTASGVVGLLQFGVGGMVAPVLSAFGSITVSMAAGMACSAIAGLLVAQVAARRPAQRAAFR